MNVLGMRVGFAGTPEFAATALRAVVAAGYAVPLVLTQPDRPAGRGMKLQASSVKQVALAHGLEVAQPQGLRLDGKFATDAALAQAALRAANLDVLVVAAYGLILPQWVLDMPRLGCLNIHGSLLPRWRGAAPIHRAIEAGDTQTGITIMQMDAGLDTGDMLLCQALPITSSDTTGTLHDQLAALGARMIVQALATRSSLQAVVQGEAGVCYAHKIDKAEGLIDWTQPASAIERRLRAFDPFPGAHTVMNGESLKCWRAQLCDNDHSSLAGEVLQADLRGLRVACGQGALLLTELQRPGAKRVPAGQVLSGLNVQVGQILGC